MTVQKDIRNTLNLLESTNDYERIVQQQIKNIERVMEDSEKVLTEMAKQECLRLSAEYDGKRAIFLSAMGSFFCQVEEKVEGGDRYEVLVEPRELETTDFMEAFQKMYDRFEYHALPSPIKVIAENGSVKVVTDW